MVPADEKYIILRPLISRFIFFVDICRFLGVTCNAVCNRSLMLSVSIAGHRPLSRAGSDTTVDSSSTGEDSPDGVLGHRATARAFVPLPFSEVHVENNVDLSSPVYVVDASPSSPAAASLDPSRQLAKFTRTAS